MLFIAITATQNMSNFQSAHYDHRFSYYHDYYDMERYNCFLDREDNSIITGQFGK